MYKPPWGAAQSTRSEGRSPCNAGAKPRELQSCSALIFNASKIVKSLTQNRFNHQMTLKSYYVPVPVVGPVFGEASLGVCPVLGHSLPLGTSRDGDGTGGTAWLCPCTRSQKPLRCWLLHHDSSHFSGACSAHPGRETRMKDQACYRPLCHLRTQSMQKLVYLLSFCSMGCWSWSNTSV